MSGTKPPSGPWDLCGFFIRTEYAMGERDKAGWLIATLDNSLPNWQDYGRLMAAAPDLLAAAQAAIAYDAAIQQCANDPSTMSSFCTAQGDDLDTLYDDWIAKARAAIAKAVGHD